MTHITTATTLTTTTTTSMITATTTLTGLSCGINAPDGDGDGIPVRMMMHNILFVAHKYAFVCRIVLIQ